MNKAFVGAGSGSALPNRFEDLLAQRHGLVLLALFVFALAIRLFGIGTQSLWTDELASVQFATQGLDHLWGRWMVAETNPPLYYTLLRVWLQLFGNSETTIRLLSALAGSAVVVLTYLLAFSRTGRRVALLAAVLTALAAQQMAYSQEARAYIFAQAAAMLAWIGVALIAERLVEPERARSSGLIPYVLYVLGCVAALYLHTTMFALPVLANVYIFACFVMHRQRVGVWLTWLGANVICLALWAWWVQITLLQLAGAAGSATAWIVKPGVGELIRVLAHVYGGKSLGVVGALVAALAMAATVMAVLRNRNYFACLLITVVLGTPALLWVISQKTPVLLDRTMLWAQPFMFCAVAWAVFSIAKDKLRVLAVVLVSSVVVADTIHWKRTEQKEPWRDIIATIAQQAGPNDVILLFPPSFGGAVEYYCGRLGCKQPIIALDDGHTGGAWSRDTFFGKKIAPKAIAAELQGFQNIWTLERTKYSPRRFLEGVATEVKTVKFEQVPSAQMQMSVWALKP